MEAGNLQASSPELERGTQGHTGPPSPLEGKLQQAEYLPATVMLQRKDRVPRLPALWLDCEGDQLPLRAGAPALLVELLLNRVILQKGHSPPRDAVSLSQATEQTGGGPGSSHEQTHPQPFTRKGRPCPSPATRPSPTKP